MNEGSREDMRLGRTKGGRPVPVSAVHYRGDLPLRHRPFEPSHFCPPRYLSQESLVVVDHLCAPEDGAVDCRLARDAEGAKQVLRGVLVCIRSFVIQVLNEASLDA